MLSSHSDLIVLLDAIMRTGGRLREAFAEARQGIALSQMEQTVLTAVVEAQRPPTVPQIGRALGHPRQVVQRAANALAERGLISQAPNPDHKRANLLLPTDAGTRLQRRANDRAEEIAERLIANLDPAEVREATRLLGSIRAGLHSPERGSPA